MIFTSCKLCATWTLEQASNTPFNIQLYLHKMKSYNSERFEPRWVNVVVWVFVIVGVNKFVTEQTPLNRCQQLPAPYKRLINDTKTDKQ